MKDNVLGLKPRQEVGGMIILEKMPEKYSDGELIAMVAYCSNLLTKDETTTEKQVEIMAKKIYNLNTVSKEGSTDKGKVHARDFEFLVKVLINNEVDGKSRDFNKF